MKEELGSSPADFPPVQPWTTPEAPEVPISSESATDPAPEEAPARVAFGVKQRLDPAYVPASRLVGWITIANLALGAVVGFVVLLFTVRWPPPVLAGIAAGALVLTLLIVWLNLAWPGLEYRRTSWRIDVQGIEIKRGVVWRHVINVPRARIQHTDVTQGPVQRRYGLATLVIHTAGTHEYEVNLEGLSHPTALAVRDELLESNGEDGA